MRNINKRGTFMVVHEEEDEEGNLDYPMSEQALFSRMNLQDMLTIVQLKNSGVSGETKKMLHSPSLKMFVVKEVPINLGRESGFEEKILDKYMKRWRKHCFSNEYLVNLYDAMWNVPHGKVSIVYEYCSSGSLKVR